MANQVRAWQEMAGGLHEPAIKSGAAEVARALLFVACLDRDGRREVAPPPSEDPIFASCRRIAQRAVSGALAGPALPAVVDSVPVVLVTVPGVLEVMVTMIVQPRH